MGSRTDSGNRGPLLIQRAKVESSPISADQAIYIYIDTLDLALACNGMHMYV